jgi:hypothetical protein
VPDTLEDLVSPTAVGTQLGETVVEPELASVEMWIARAIDEMRDKAPTLDADLAAGRVTAVRVQGVGVDVVIRALENQRIGHRVTSQKFPDIETGYAPADGDSIYLTASEIARLQPKSDAAQAPGEGGMYVVPLSG